MPDPTPTELSDSKGAVERFIPGIHALGSYNRSWFRPDLLAGVTVWAMLVPQALGYSTLAGMPSVYGLYAALGALVLYWIWGSSRELNVGPESTVAIMIATILAPIAVAGSDEYVAAAAMLAILVGLVLIIGGLFKLGRIADFLSRPILAGYVFGSGLLIVASQLPDFLGIDVDSSLYATDIGSVIRNLDQTDATALALGLATIALILLMKRYVVAIPGALVAVVLGIIAVWLFGLDVDVVGAFESGLPAPGLPDIPLDQIPQLIGPAFAVALLVYPDSVLTARSLSTMNGYRIDPNREFYGIGAANIGSSLLGGFAVNGSQSRSFVVSDAKAKSQVANLWSAAFVLLTLLVLAPIFEYLPSAVLAGIVIVAGLALLAVGEFKQLWRYRRTEFWMAVFTAGAVVLIGMLVGIVIAIALSMILVVMRAASPHTATLGRVGDTDTYRDIEDHPETETFPGLFIYRFDAPLFFANSGRFRQDLGSAVDADATITTIIIDAESIYDIDSTGAQTLMEAMDELDAIGIDVAFARVRTEIMDEMESVGLTQRLYGEGIYLEVDDAVADYLSRQSPDA
ncbi:MAG: SulP family inorganic anion transporter [Acidimicrobiia bacterium]